MIKKQTTVKTNMPSKRDNARTFLNRFGFVKYLPHKSQANIHSLLAGGTRIEAW
jgi:hypothetical protein